MATKLKRNRILQNSLCVFWMISFFALDVSFILKRAISSDANWRMDVKLAENHQMAAILMDVSLFIFLLLCVVWCKHLKPIITWNRRFITFIIFIFLLVILYIYKLHFFVVPIWYEKTVLTKVVCSSLLDEILILPIILCVIKLVKTIPYHILAKTRLEVQKENEEKEANIEKMRHDLLANISHDLRTPITSIISYIDILKCQDLDQDSKEYVGIIDKKANVLRNMVDDVVYLSKLTSGNIPINTERINLKCFLSQVIFEWEEDCGISQECFDYQEKGTDAFVETDGNKLYRIFQNILDNALKYRKQNSIICVTYQNTDDCVKIEVRNESSYPLLFDGEDMLQRFVRGDKSRNSEGHGLGLAIANELIKMCNGRMEVVTEGQVFIVKMKFFEVGI